MNRISRALGIDKNHLLFLGGGLAFVVFTWYVVTRRYEFLFALPFVIATGVVAVYNLRTLWLLAAFCVPMSVNLSGFIEAAALRVPTDALCIGLCLLLLFKMLSEGGETPLRFVKHPLFWVVGAWFGWMLLVSIHSEMPVVSFKRDAALLWMAGGFFFLSIIFFSDKRYIFRYFWVIGLCFAFVLLTILFFYVISGRNPFGLRFNPAPFFDDHTALGAFTSMLVPLFTLFALSRTVPRGFRISSAVLLSFLILGLFFSYSRGAWASAFIGLVVMALILNRRILKYLLIPGAILLGLASLLVYQNFSGSIRESDAVSRKTYLGHVVSITNFKTDDSNAERINRWNCAIKMFQERPWTGFGPGTYTFVYGDYQMAVDHTMISTNHGDNGSAHNEFLLAISETGLPGGILTLILFLFPVYLSLKRHFTSTDPQLSVLYLGIALSLFTYETGAVVNNFLDQDKVFAVFFGLLAAIIALDVYHQRGRVSRGSVPA